MLAKLPDPIADPHTWGEVDGPTLLAAASALQLCPDNVPWLLGLQRLAAIAAGIPSRPNARTLSSSKFKSLLSTAGVGNEATRGMQDPFEGLFAFEVPFYEGPRLTVQGLATNSGMIADFLLTAIFRATQGSLPGTFLIKVKALADLLLTISDRMCRSAGLDRWSTANDDGRRVHVPSATTLAEMSTWVQLDEEELFAGLPDLAREYLTIGLVRNQGQPVPLGGVPSEWSMVQPLVRSGTKLTVAAPPDLTATLRHHIVRASTEEGCSEQLVEVMLSLAVNKAKELLGSLTDSPFEVVAEGRSWARLQAPFDADKLMDVVVLVDGLEDYDPFSAYGQWEATGTFEEIEQGTSVTANGDRVLRIFMPAPVGRDLAVGWGSEGDLTPTLFASWDELQIILQTPGFDGLGLWYFARAERLLLQRTHVMSFSALDTFAVYRDHGMSFYLSDGPAPSFLNIEVASGQMLREENAHRHDRRHFIKPSDDGYIEAWALHGRLSSPVYIARVPLGAAFIVDLDAATAWVHVVQLSKGDVPDSAQLIIVVAEALAYWIWQLWLAEPNLIERATSPAGIVNFTVRSAASEPEPSSWLRASLSDANGLIIEVSSAHTPAERGNQNDRDLLAELYRILGGVDSGIVDRVAPIGQKGMMHLRSHRAMSAWALESEPAWHSAEEANSELLDELGLHLIGDLQLPIGKIPNDGRVNMLTNQVVPWLIDRLRDEIGELSGSGTIERLIERNEALIAHSARESELLAPRIACFGAGDDEAQQIQRRLTYANISLMTSRFLIEFASAFPPAGHKGFNRERYERLMALGSEIINKGMLADSLRSKLTDVRLSVLESGRLGTSTEVDSYMNAIEMFSQFRAQSVLADASDNGADHAAQIPDRTSADGLAVDAFGFSYTDLIDGARVLLDLLEDRETITIRKDVVHDTLVDSLHWETAKIDTVLDTLTLSPFPDIMAEFWKDGVSVFPWRFNRDRSYLKRPLVQLDDEITFGRRAMSHVPSYWLEQFRSGRLRATGNMASALSEQRNTKGRAFELKVATLLRGIGYGPVKERFRRVGKFDFRNLDGKNLGDIDVAAVLPGRRELLLIEAKDLEVARTPAELRNEVDQLIGPGNTAIRRLQQRADWVASNLGIVLAEFNITDATGWAIRTLVVVNQPLLSEYLLNEPISVIAVDRMSDYLAAADRGVLITDNVRPLK